MIVSINKTTLFIGLATFASLEVINWRVQYIYWLSSLLLILLLIIIWLSLVRCRPIYKLMVWFIPAINFLAWASFLTIINSSLVRQVLILVAVVIQLVYWWRGWPAWLGQNKPAAWWRLVNAVNLLTVWLAAASLYGWQSFLAWPIWWAWLLWLAVSGLILWSDYQASDLSPFSHWPIILSKWLIGGQLFLAIYFLPSSNLVQAYLLLIAYYIASQIGRGSLLKINTARRLRYQFLILAVSSLLVLLTAKWF
ncbi:hypothetical protein EOM71_01295 [Candidatus Falkowbacteria bacterium]|jgi:hypothetical protein|nr:hypothetical protein [Candidatus Falkowbacteria bacterium]